MSNQPYNSPEESRFRQRLRRVSVVGIGALASFGLLVAGLASVRDLRELDQFSFTTKPLSINATETPLQSENPLEQGLKAGNELSNLSINEAPAVLAPVPLSLGGVIFGDEEDDDREDYEHNDDRGEDDEDREGDEDEDDEDREGDDDEDEED